MTPSAPTLPGAVFCAMATVVEIGSKDVTIPVGKDVPGAVENIGEVFNVGGEVGKGDGGGAVGKGEGFVILVAAVSGGASVMLVATDMDGASVILVAAVTAESSGISVAMLMSGNGILSLLGITVTIVTGGSSEETVGVLVVGGGAVEKGCGFVLLVAAVGGGAVGKGEGETTVAAVGA